MKEIACAALGVLCFAGSLLANPVRTLVFTVHDNITSREAVYRVPKFVNDDVSIPIGFEGKPCILRATVFTPNKDVKDQAQQEPSITFFIDPDLHYSSPSPRIEGLQSILMVIVPYSEERAEIYKSDSVTLSAQVSEVK